MTWEWVVVGGVEHRFYFAWKLALLSMILAAFLLKSVCYMEQYTTTPYLDHVLP